MRVTDAEKDAIGRTIARHENVIRTLMEGPATCLATLKDYREERDTLVRVLVAAEVGE